MARRLGRPTRQALRVRGGGPRVRRGLSNREIADKLVLSNATVKTRINRIFYKTGARDRAQASCSGFRDHQRDPPAGKCSDINSRRLSFGTLASRL